MALIKKYNSGGKADNKKSFFDHLNQKILTNADNLSIRDQEEILRSLSSPDFSPETSNNKYIQSEYQKYSSQPPRTVEIDPTGGEKLDRTLGSLFDYIVKKEFKGNKEYALRTISDLGKNKDGTYDNKKIQKYLIEKAREMTFEYSRDSASDISGDNWKDKEHADNLISVLNEINTEDISEDSWNKFSDFSNPLGWQVNNLLMKPEEIARLSQISEYNQEQEKAKDEQKSNFDYFDSIGIKDEDMQKGLYEQGFRQIKEDDKNTPEFMRNYFQDKGYSLISDGKNRLVWNGEDFVKEDSGLFTDDQFSSNYGTGYSIGENGVLSTFDRDSIPSGFKLPEWEDVGNIRQQLLTESGKFGDYDLNEWRVIGDSNDNHQGDYVRDILQRRDLTGRVTLENEKTKEKKVFVRQENGDYLDSASGEIVKKGGYSFLSPGEFKESIAPDFVRGRWENPKITRLHNRDARSPETAWGKFWNSDKDIHDVIKDFDTERKSLLATGKINKKETIKLIEHLKHYGVNGTAEEKQLANEQLEKILEVLSHTDDYGKETFAEFKLGGIIRSQQGGSLWERTAAYVPDVESDYDPHKDYTQQQKSTEPKKVIDTQGTFSDSDIWEKISTGAAIASFFPGVGVAGGAISTVADAIHGAKDGWDWGDTANLAANIGFTGLSLIGLGGLKGVKLVGKAGKMGKIGRVFNKAGKAGKVLDKAGDVKGLAQAGKMAKKAGPEALKAVDRVTKLTTNNKLPNTIQKLLSNADDISNFDEIAKLATKAGYTVKKGDTAKTLAKVISSDLDAVNKLSRMSTTAAGSIAKATGRGINTAVTKGIEVLPGKVGQALKYGAIGNQVIQGGASAKSIYDNVQEHGLKDGLRYAQLSDIRKVGQLGALGYSSYQNNMNKKAYLQNSTEVGATPEQYSIKIGDKTYKTTGKVDTSKGFWGKIKDGAKGTTAKGKVAVRSENQTKLKEKIKKVLDPSEADKIDEIVKGITKNKGEVTNLYTAGTAGTRVVNENPLDYSYKALKRHKRARRVEAYQTGNYSTSFMNRWFNRNPQLAPRPEQASVSAPVTVKPVTTTAPAAKINKVTKRAPRRPLTGPARGPQRATTQNPTKGNLKVAPKAPSVEKTVKKAFNDYLKTSGTYGSNNTKFSNFAKTKKGKELVKKYGYKKLKEMSGIGKKKEGGILLARTGLTLPGFQWDKGIKTHLGNQYKIGGPRPTVDTSKEALATLARPGYTPFTAYKTNFNTDLNLPTRLGRTPTETAQEGLGNISVKMPALEAWKKKRRLDLYPAVETMKYLNVKNTNDRASAEMEKSFSETPQYSGYSRTHIRTGSPFSLMYDREARNQMALSGRLGKQTSDLSLGIESVLQGAKNAADLRLRGQTQDIERNDGIQRQQMESDNRVDSANISTYNKQKEDNAKARIGLHQWRATKHSKDGSNRNALLSAGLAWHEGKQQKDAAHNYRDFVTNNPNFTKVQEGYNNLINLEADFKRRHRESLAKNWTTETKFENSREGKEYARILKEYRENYMDPLRAETERLRFAAFGG